MNHQSKGQPLRLGPFCCCYEACLYLKISLSSGQHSFTFGKSFHLSIQNMHDNILLDTTLCGFYKDSQQYFHSRMEWNKVTFTSKYLETLTVRISYSQKLMPRYKTNNYTFSTSQASLVIILFSRQLLISSTCLM